MKVKCVHLIDKMSGASVQKDVWLTVGRIYHVLSIFIEHPWGLKFQLIGDDGRTPAYFEADQFEVVSDVISSNWCIEFKPNSHFGLIPKPWSRPGFLEDYFDGVKEAELIFESERKKIIEEDP